MRNVIGVCATALLLMGCLHRHPSTPPPRHATPPPQSQPVATQSANPIIKPDLRPEGQVAMVNEQARFAVISFPGGPVPENGRQLVAYHNGAKVAELRVTGPQRENDTVADIISGEAQVGDQVRSE